MKVCGGKKFLAVLLLVLVGFIAAGVHRSSLARQKLIPVEGVEEMIPTRKDFSKAIGSFEPLSDSLIRMSSFSNSKLFRVPLKHLQLPEGGNGEGRKAAAMLLLPNPHLLEVEAFVLRQNRRSYSTYTFRNSLTVSDMPLSMRYPVLLLDPITGEVTADDYLYLRVRSLLPLSCGIYLTDSSSFMQLYVKNSLYYMMFFAVLLSFGLAHLFLFVMTGERPYARALVHQLFLFLLTASFHKNIQIYFDLPLAAVSGIAWSMYGLLHISIAYGYVQRLKHRIWARRLSLTILCAQSLLAGMLLKTAYQEAYFWTFAAALTATVLNILGQLTAAFSMILDEERSQKVFFFVASNMMLYMALGSLFAAILHPGLLDGMDTLYCSAFFLAPALYACFLFSQTRDRFDKSLALERQIFHAEQLSQREPLTGLFNKTYFEYTLGETIRDVLILNRDIACIVIDIDHFGYFCEAWGEAEGERVLRLVAQVIQESLRDRDIAAHYAGDTFCVMLNGAGLAIAQIVAERIHRGCEKQFLALGEDKELTLSLGISLFRPDDTPESLICRAEKALIYAKKLGRNQMAVQD